MTEPMTDEQLQAKALEIVRMFTPDTPIRERELFAGRMLQLVRAVNAAAQRGQHVAIYGRPGVGKASLANMIAPALGEGAKVVVRRWQGGRPLPNVADDETLVILGDVPDDPSFVPVLLGPMTAPELRQMVERRLMRVSMTMDDDAKGRIAELSHGLPRHALQLTLDAALDALLRERSTHIHGGNVMAAMRRALQDAPPEIANPYRRAVASPRRNLFRELVLACAVAPSDDLGWFTPNGVCAPLKQLTRKSYEPGWFTPRLHEFAKTRGPILERSGKSYHYRFRFANPLTEPYVLMRGVVDGLLDRIHRRLE